MPKSLFSLLIYWLSFIYLHADSFDPGRLTAVTLLEQLNQPMELAVAPDGRIFFIELNGEFRVLDPQKGEPALIRKFEVARRGEVGLIGLALDPNFENNNWVYLQYSPIGLTSQRTSRFTLQGNKIEEGSEKKLIEFHEPVGISSHHAGSIEFGPSGCLFISTGDDTSPGGDSKGYAPIDNRPGQLRLSAEKSSSNPFSYNGKVLRIRPMDDGGYEVPAGNLFPKDGTKGLPEVYVMGCRNPWRINLNQKTGTLYFGDVGPDAYLEGERGPAGHDEINQVKQAGNFGWPYFVGNNFAYPMRDFNTSELHPAQNPDAPVNHSLYVEGNLTLPPAKPAFIWYRTKGTPEFKILRGGGMRSRAFGRTACAGPVFHYNSKLKSETKLPKHFDNCLFIYEWTRNWVFTARLDKNEELVDLEPFMPDHSFIRPIDMEFGPDGALYLIEYGTTWGKNENAKLVRIDYIRGNRPPVAKISADQTAGKAPLTIRLSSEGSQDPDKGDTLSYEWRKIPGDDSILSTSHNPTLTLEDFGNLKISLTVKDAAGVSAKATLPVSVGNGRPSVKIVSPQNGDFFEFGKPIEWVVEVSDEEDVSIDSNRIKLAHKVAFGSSSKQPTSLQGEIHPGLGSMKASDCFNCHSVAQQLVGPSFSAISEKYQGVKKARNEAAHRIIHGSSGVWGQIPMMPHPQHSSKVAREMVDWIFSLGQEEDSVQRGNSGSLIVEKPKDTPNQSLLLLEASYMDGGALPVAPLRGSQLIQLRPREIQGIAADFHEGVILSEKVVGHIGHGSYLCYQGINLTGITEVVAKVASAGAGAEVQLRIGSSKGKLIGKTLVSPNGSWSEYFDQTTTISPTAGRHDLYVCFHKPGKNGLMNLASLQFN
ncbi:PQQ-dependent sugar dehydrogenase [Opitutales bacterium]|nr:PQQ-dependent sugar dehydrogenase [Opitutales bacterium]